MAVTMSKTVAESFRLPIPVPETRPRIVLIARTTRSTRNGLAVNCFYCYCTEKAPGPPTPVAIQPFPSFKL